jgi:hypothetical protein
MSHIKDIHNVACGVIGCDSHHRQMSHASATYGLSDMKDALQNAPCNQPPKHDCAIDLFLAKMAENTKEERSIAPNTAPY